MARYIVHRLFLMIPTLLGITAVVFFVMAMSPGGVGGSQMNMEGEIDSQTQKAMRDYYNKRYGLTKPLPVQYVRWLNMVSPVGFLSAEDIEFTEAQTDLAVQQLIEATLSGNSTKEKRETAKRIKALAANLASDPQTIATTVIDKLNRDDIDYCISLYDKLGTPAEKDLKQSMFEQFQADPTSARRALFELITDRATSENLILLSRPTFKKPNLGRSFSKSRKVLDLYGEALPVTLTLNLITIPVIYTIAILSGIYAARHKGKAFDVISGTTYIGLWSIPPIWAGVMLIGYLASEKYLKIFPADGLSSTMAGDWPFLPYFTDGQWHSGWLVDRMWHMVLPLICMIYGGMAFLSKLMRGAMLESLSADFVRTARAKGVSEQHVLFHHAFRNSLLPLITVAANILPALLVGSVIIESIFTINGMGLLTIDGIFARDRELVLAGTLVGGLLGLSCQIIRDVAYAIADPRVSYD